MEKAEKEIVQKQTIPNENFDAKIVGENFLDQSIKFDQTKRILNKFSNYYINHLFSLLGYQFKGKVENVNILHLCAEAWLLGAFRELKKENYQKAFSNHTTYSKLFSHIKQIIVEEKEFIDDLNLLTGTYGLNEFALEDKNIFKMFLVNIQATKNELIFENEKEMTRQSFEEIMLRIFRIAFNHTLNEYNSAETEKNSLDMLSTYLDFSGKDGPKSLQDFIKSYYLKKETKLSSGIDSENQRRINNILENYFNFLNTTFDDLVEEIGLFNQNSFSILFKLKTLLSLKNLQRLYSKYMELLTNSLKKGSRNLRLEGVLNFTMNMYELLSPYSEKPLRYLKKTYSQLKLWVNSAAEMPLTYYKITSKHLMQYPSEIYQASLRFSAIPRNLVFEKVYTPLRNLTINLKDSSVNVAVNTYELGKNKTLQLEHSIEDKVTNLKNNIFGEEPLIKIEEDSHNKFYLNISISKRLFIIDPTKAMEILTYIIELVRYLSLAKISTSAYNYTRKKVDQTRNLIYTSFKKFLELANEEENDEDLLLKSLTNQVKDQKQN